MERVDSSETSDEGFNLFGNGVPVRTLKFNSGIGGLLGEGGGVIGTERGIATEENVGDDGCAEMMSLIRLGARV